MPASDHSLAIHTLVQITDSHLYADSAQSLLGMPTSESLKAVVELVAREQPEVNLLLATGDISQDASVESYLHFVEQAQRINAPMRWLPGNHDDVPVQLAASAKQDWSQPLFDLPNWRIVLLDSVVAGTVHGYLQQSQLDVLEQALKTAGKRHVLVCLHHHPIFIDCKWMDDIGLRNADEFFAVLDRYPAVKGVIWGHIHQEVDIERDGVRLLAAPSTCIQFEPHSEDFALDTRLPGYRWLRLHPDGHIETEVSRLQHFAYEPDYSQNGY